jgi:hypothetical protein
MERILRVVLAFVCLAALACPVARAQPPFSGTIFIDPNIITASDPTTFTGITYAGQGIRTMFDRRVNSFIDVNAFLVNATFRDGLAAEIQVNPEFGSVAAARISSPPTHGTIRPGRTSPRVSCPISPCATARTGFRHRWPTRSPRRSRTGSPISIVRTSTCSRFPQVRVVVGGTERSSPSLARLAVLFAPLSSKPPPHQSSLSTRLQGLVSSTGWTPTRQRCCTPGYSLERSMCRERMSAIRGW